MLKDFKSEWDAVWKLTDGLKTGVTVKALQPDIVMQLNSLHDAVTAYQQCVSAYNTAAGQTPPGDVGDLGDKALSTFATVQSLQSSLQIAFDMQIQANKNVQSGALQMPQDTPQALYNPTLQTLNEKINSVVSATSVDLTSVGLVEDLTPAETLLREGTQETVDTEDKNYDAPDWLSSI